MKNYIHKNKSVNNINYFHKIAVNGQHITISNIKCLFLFLLFIKLNSYLLFIINMITIKFNDNISLYYSSFEEILKLENYNDIIYINCRNNLISSLPVLPNSLMYLYCNNNILSSLPELPNSKIDICYKYNPIHTYIKKYFNDKHQQYFDYQRQMKRIFANKIGNWYLDCKYNPKYLYCRKRLMEEYDDLYN